MEENNKQLSSILGKWWVPVRKWFYPAWLTYETSIRFYEYSASVDAYFDAQQADVAAYIGELGTQILAGFCSGATFVVCTAFLTVPACFVLYEFFKKENLTGSAIEQKMKTFF